MHWSALLDPDLLDSVQEPNPSQPVRAWCRETRTTRMSHSSPSRRHLVPSDKYSCKDVYCCWSSGFYNSSVNCFQDALFCTPIMNMTKYSISSICPGVTAVVPPGFNIVGNIWDDKSAQLNKMYHKCLLTQCRILLYCNIFIFKPRFSFHSFDSFVVF